MRRCVGGLLCWIHLHRWSDVLALRDEVFKNSTRPRRQYARICLRVDCHARKHYRHITTVPLDRRSGRSRS